MKRTPSFVIIIWSLWFLLVYGIVISYALPNSLIKYDVKKNLLMALPQGWGFFTRNPKEAIVEAYSYNNGNLELATVCNTAGANYLGFSRKSRFIGYELGMLLKHVPHSAWANEKGDHKINPIPHLSTIIASDSIKESLTFFPKGEYVFYQYKLVPFEWASKSQEKYRPYLVARIKIQ